MSTDIIQPTPANPENLSPEIPSVKPREKPILQPIEQFIDKSSGQLAKQPAEETSQERAKKQIETSAKKNSPRWQERLLPLMSRLLIGVTLFFFLATFLQMSYLHWSILNSPAIDINPGADIVLATSAIIFSDRIEARRLEVLSRMEAYLVQQRYHHASVLMMSGLWIRYLGFVTGMILALVGASFVLGKLREPASELTGKFPTGEGSLRTTSPGIILVVLGVVLMFTTIVNRDIYEVKDVPVYLNVITNPSIPPEIQVPTMIPPEEYPTPNPSLPETPTAPAP
jgi:hypothetical protein